MKKRILSMLLVVVMVVSMLPATVFDAFAYVEWTPGGPAKMYNFGQHISVSEGYKPSFAIDDNGRVYEVTKYVNGAINPLRVAHTDYEDGIPTLYLYGANIGKYDPATYTSGGGYSYAQQALSGLANETDSTSKGFPYKIVVTKDSSISAYQQLVASYGACAELIIECRNNAVLTLNWDGSQQAGFDVPKITLLNANIVVNQTNASGTQSLFKCTDLTIDNSTIVAENLGGMFAQVTNLTIKDGSEVVAISKGQVIEIASKLDVIDSSLTAYRTGTNTASGTIGRGAIWTDAGAITFTNSTIDIQSTNTNNGKNWMNALVIAGAGSLTINSGNVNLRANSYSNTGGLKMSNGGRATINGGTVYIGGFNSQDIYTSNGGVQISDNSLLTINGGNVTIQSSRPAINGPWTYNGGTVTLISHHHNAPKPSAVMPTFGISDYSIRAGKLDEEPSVIVTDLNALITQHTIKDYQVVRITEGKITDGKLNIAGTVTLTSSSTGTVSYAKTDANGVVTAYDKATAESKGDWNIKYEVIDHVPTLTLKGATIGNVSGETWTVNTTILAASMSTKLHIVVLENSIMTAYADGVSGLTDLIIESVDNAKLTMVNHGDKTGLIATNITLKNANLEMNTNGIKQYGKCIGATTLNIDGGNVVISGANYEYNKQAVLATTINITNGANVTVTNNNSVAIRVDDLTVTGSTLTAAATEGVIAVANTLTVTDSTFTATCTYGVGSGGQRGVITTETGAITFTNSTVNVGKVKNGNYTHGIWISGAGSFTVNSGNVTLGSGSADNRYGLYLQAGATANIKGGTVAINGYDDRDFAYDEEGKPTTNYFMGNGAVKVEEGASFTISGGNVTLRSSRPAVSGLMTVTGGTVILIAHRYGAPQFLDTEPVLPENCCISMSHPIVEDEKEEPAYNGADPIGSNPAMLTREQAYRYCRISAHVEGEAELEVSVEPTCGTTGLAAEVVRCEYCHEILSASEDVIVPATGDHIPGEIVIENEVAAGLTTPGSYDEVTYCEDCGKETSRKTVVTEPVGERPSITVETVEANAGAQSVVVKITVDKNPGIVYAQLLISYDADKLELVSFADGGIWGTSLTPATMIKNNPFMATWNNSTITEDITANGVVLTLTFNVKSGATGMADITVSYDPDNVYNFDMDNVTFATVDGGVNIAAAHVHNYVATVVAPGFGTPGYTLHECSCGVSYTDTPTAALTADFIIEDGKVIMQLAEGYTNGDITTVFIGNEDADLTHWNNSVLVLGKKYSDANGANGYRYYSGLKNGSTVLLNGNGNYVVRMRYKDANGEQQTVIKQITLSDLNTKVPVIEGVDANNDLIISNTSGNKNWAVSVFYIGNNSVSNAYTSWDNMVKYGKETPEFGGQTGYRSFTKLANIQLPYAGNYVVRIVYTDANGNSQMVCKQMAVETAIVAPTIVGIDKNNDLVITQDGMKQFVSFSVFYLGNKTVKQPYNDWDTLVAYGREDVEINTRVGYRWYGKKDNVQLTKAGNYVIRMKYLDAAGIARIIVKTITIEESLNVPVVSMDGHKLIIDMPEGVTKQYASVFYLGNESVNDPYNEWTRMNEIGRKNTFVNTDAGYRTFSPTTVPTMFNLRLNYKGNYVVRVIYTDAAGVVRVLSKMITIEADANIPTVTIDGNNVIVNKVDGFTGYILSVSYLKGQTLRDAYSQYNDMKRIGKYYSYYNGDSGYKMYNGNNLNNCVLSETGNYAIRLIFNEVNPDGSKGVQQLVAYIYNHTAVQ